MRQASEILTSKGPITIISFMISKLISYIQESRRELERVNWPTRNETIRLTVVVIGMSLAVAFFLGAIDFLFSFLMKSFLL